jgi:hypothetical protein
MTLSVSAALRKRARNAVRVSAKRRNAARWTRAFILRNFFCASSIARGKGIHAAIGESSAGVQTFIWDVAVEKQRRQMLIAMTLLMTALLPHHPVAFWDYDASA